MGLKGNHSGHLHNAWELVLGRLGLGNPLGLARVPPVCMGKLPVTCHQSIVTVPALSLRPPLHDKFSEVQLVYYFVIFLGSGLALKNVRNWITEWKESNHCSPLGVTLFPCLGFLGQQVCVEVDKSGLINPVYPLLQYARGSVNTLVLQYNFSTMQLYIFYKNAVKRLLWSYYLTRQLRRKNIPQPFWGTESIILKVQRQELQSNGYYERLWKLEMSLKNKTKQKSESHFRASPSVKLIAMTLVSIILSLLSHSPSSLL